MDAATAEQLGSQDRIEGKGNAPLANPAMITEFQDAPVGSKTNLLKAYNRGWQRQHHRITEEQGRSQNAQGQRPAQLDGSD